MASCFRFSQDKEQLTKKCSRVAELLRTHWKINRGNRLILVVTRQEPVLTNALMAPDLRALITDFRVVQDRAIDYLHTDLRIPLPKSGPDWVRNGHRAVLDAVKLSECSAIKLAPHGYGIDVIHPNFRIDFDYGPNGEIDCFDVWRLALHRYHLTDAKPPVGPYNDIREWVNDAVGKCELLIVPKTYDAFFQDPTLLRAPEAVHRIG